MLKVGMQKSEIEKELNGKGPFIQIDHLNRFLKEPLTMDMKRFIFMKLADIYASLNMFRDTAKMYSSVAGISITFSDKIKYFMKETEAYVSGGDFARADEAMKKAVGEANTLERQRIYQEVVGIYKKQAEKYEKENKRGKTAEVYEKLIEISASPTEKDEFKQKLVSLYEKLGRMKEIRDMERGMKRGW